MFGSLGVLTKLDIRFEDCRNIVLSCIDRTVGRVWLYDEDVVQSGWQGLLEALQRFDVGRGVKWYTYCWYWIRKRVQEEVLRKRQICCYFSQLEEFTEGEFDVVSDYDLEYEYFRFVELKENLKRFLKSVLDDLEYEVVVLRLVWEKSFREISELLELEFSVVVKLFNSAFRKLEEVKDQLVLLVGSGV